MQDTSLKKHWENAYDKDSCLLGWYEESSTPSLNLIDTCSLSADARILNVGGGSSTIVDSLVTKGYTNIIHHDLSQTALDITSERLNDQANLVQFIQDDLTAPTTLQKLQEVDLWHDRAVLHFFTEEKDRKTYFDLLRDKVKKGGYVILAAFHLDGGAEKCSNLPVYRYNVDLFRKNLGNDFQLIEDFDYIYTNPGGHPRKYIYSLWQKKN